MTELIKTSRQIKIMQRLGHQLAEILFTLIEETEVGTNLLEIEEKACKLIAKTGGQPAFKRVPGYSWATCLNINEGIVHGVPFDYSIENGDVVSIDIGLYDQGLNTDMCRSFVVGESSGQIDTFLKTGEKTLAKAVKVARPGNHVGDISLTIQQSIEGAGYTCSRSLTGHGVGQQLHEPPNIPCFLSSEISKTPELKPGMTLAIEVIYSLGKADLIVDSSDRWTIRMKDGKIAAVFENTIAILKTGPLVLTKV